MKNTAGTFGQAKEFVDVFGSFLLLETVFFKYDGIPILSTCKDDFGRRYICNCTEFRNDVKWVIYLVSLQQLLDLLENRDTIYNVCNNPENPVYIYYDNGNEAQLSQIYPTELALCDQLPTDEYLCEYSGQFSKYENCIRMLTEENRHD